MSPTTICTHPMISTIQSRFDYLERWNYLEAKGKEKFGPRFRFHLNDAEVIIKLTIWFLKDYPAAEQFGIDLHKGIFLNGPVGCGKTCLMNIFKSIMHGPDRHAVFSCSQIAYEYAAHGHSVFQRYSKSSFYRPDVYEGPVHICFDDLGAEPEVQFYGMPCNPMAEILFSRYDYFTSHKMLTHITTNYNSTKIEERYGHRIKSRIREMMNIFSFSHESNDKRK